MVLGKDFRGQKTYKKPMTKLVLVCIFLVVPRFSY